MKQQSGVRLKVYGLIPINMIFWSLALTLALYYTLTSETQHHF